MNLPEPQLIQLLARPPLSESRETRHRALYLRLKQAVATGQLKAHSRLPGGRRLAALLGVSRNTVEAALEQLVVEGYLRRDKQGSQVLALPRAVPPAPTSTVDLAQLAGRMRAVAGYPARGESPLLLQPGCPSIYDFPLNHWQRCRKYALQALGMEALAYGPPLGERALRAAVARHLSLSRAVPCDLEQVVITQGTRQALDICVQLLTNPGDTAWVENPGYPSAQVAFRAGDLALVPVAVDDEGIAPTAAQWRDTPPKLIYTTPSHQYPLGYVMSAARRLALLDNASRSQSWIIEDDYDSEFRHSGEPVAAMQGMIALPPVIYVGTFSKTLFPALGVGFMVLPPQLIPAVGWLKPLLRGGDRLAQLALAEFIERGYYSRHLSAMRRQYSERQKRLRQLLAAEIPVAHRIYGGAGGMHLTLALAADIDDRALVRQLQAAGIGPGALSRFYMPGTGAQPGLVIGYGGAPLSRLEGAIHQLARRLRAG
ncbi:PLP-dependent aminotransferase family protein [Shimwellia pseudoproteus]|uniref:MocR-like pyridoxine biosynthesis transcription factor PdxR n=1 Tax=Shimwellia pseudoproteus TaxID=570012 RepID=UPI0018EDA6F3|nr:PLP-dependent aminotransferase family protein [Shimwellia pseudoproteus]MBJ3814370.1 PLP-dependent aminotransferase family protein [Shimwellia pseudoproteus]